MLLTRTDIGVSLADSRNTRPHENQPFSRRDTSHLLQQPAGNPETSDRVRGWPVGIGSRPCFLDLRPEVQGLHGPSQLRPEARPKNYDGNLRGPSLSLSQ